MVDPGADERRAVLYAQMVGQRGYSRAELLHALRNVPFDSEASHRFGRGLNLADIERSVEKVRAVRSSLRRLLTPDEVAAAVRASGGTITHEHFGVGGYDERDRPLYRYRMASSAVAAPEVEVEL